MSGQLRRSPNLSRASHKSAGTCSVSAMSCKKTHSWESLSQLTSLFSEQNISRPDFKSSSSASGDTKYHPSATASFSRSPSSHSGKAGQKNALVRYNSFGNSGVGAAKTDESDNVTAMDASNFTDGENRSHFNIKNDASMAQNSEITEEDWDWFPSEEHYNAVKNPTHDAPPAPPPGDEEPHIPRNISFTSPNRPKKAIDNLPRATSAAQIGEGTLSTEDAMSISEMSPPSSLVYQKQSNDFFLSLSSPTHQGYQSFTHICTEGSMWLGNDEVVAAFESECVDLEKLESELTPDARKLMLSDSAPDAATVTPDSECASSKSTVTLTMDEDVKKRLAIPSDSPPNSHGAPSISNGTVGKAFYNPNTHSSLETLTADPAPESSAGVAIEENPSSEPSDAETTASFMEYIESLGNHGDGTNGSVDPFLRFSKDEYHLVDIDQDEITNEDIYCGKENKNSTHPGNIEFRRLIQVYKAMYQGFGSQHGMKTKLRNYIVDRKLFGGRSRFIVKRGNDTFYLQTETKVRNKVNQALREKSNSD